MHLILRRVVLGLAAIILPLSWAPTVAAQSSSFAGKTLTIGIHNRAPWGYRDKDGQVLGYHVDLARAALGGLGVKQVEFVVADFGALIPGLIAQRFDLVASGVAITPARCKQVLFGEPDLSGGDGLLVLKGNPHKLHSYQDIARNAAVRLGGGRGSENARNALLAGVPEDRLLLFPNAEAVISAMLAGRVDAATIGSATAATMMASGSIKGVERAVPFTGHVKADGTPHKLVTGVAFRRTDTALRDAYNVELAKLKASGTVAALMAKYGFTEDEAPPALSTAAICAGEN